MITRCATKNDRIRVPEDNLILPISESLVNQDQKTSCTWGMILFFQRIVLLAPYNSKILTIGPNLSGLILKSVKVKSNLSNRLVF
jgi:hypothetical protein